MSGRIGEVLSADSAGCRSLLDNAKRDGTLLELRKHQYLLPGMVDLHIHAPQWPQLGKALQLPLEEWLQQHTFPLEARYANLDFARAMYKDLVTSLLANGTTTATYFGTIHLEATKLLADTALAHGQRAVIGKVAMDNQDQCPDFYRDASTNAGIDDTRAFIEYVHDLNDAARPLIHAAVTPRFIPSCTDDMLRELGRMASKFDCHVQTHCSESDWQHQYVMQRHGISDTQSLDRFGLLTDKTILAHAILLSDADMSTIKTTASGVAHCPLSNLYFSHAVFPCRKALDFGLKLGLGTDISGGSSPSVLHNCQVAVNVSRALEDGVDGSRPPAERGSPRQRIDFREAFWMATAGGADVLGLNVGQFTSGYEFDAILVDTASADSNINVYPDLDSAEDVLQKIVNNGGRQNISKVWVGGTQVSGD